jgi:hypothetical protein
MMKRIVVTNNKRVKAQYAGKAEVIYLGSLVFFKEAYQNAPEDKSVSVLDACIEETKKLNGDANKEPILAGIFQKKDLEIVKKILA